MRSENEVAQVLARSWGEVELSGLNNWQLRTLRAIKDCRTVALGGHVDACDSCGHIQISYNSCRNRHCPKCQGHKRVQWIEARETELLPVPYFHVVFTLPDDLNGLAMHKPKIIYDALFRAAWDTIEAFTGKGNKAGMISILHTWGQNLSLHPHIHCIIPGGFVDQNGVWKMSKSDGKFLFPVKAMSRVYRAKYVALLRGQKKTMTLSHEEFVRRFALHILPKRFVRIRHYGFLSSTWKRIKLSELQCKLTGIHLQQLPIIAKGTYLKTCPCCRNGQMITLLTFGRRGPPAEFYKSAYEKPTSQVSI